MPLSTTPSRRHTTNAAKTRHRTTSSRIDFDLLKREFKRSPKKKTTVQNLRQALEQRLRRMLAQNPLRTDFQQHYEEIVAEYNREKDRVTIEKTFEDLLRFTETLDEEEERAVREGLGHGIAGHLRLAEEA